MFLDQLSTIVRGNDDIDFILGDFDINLLAELTSNNNIKEVMVDFILVKL